MSVLNSLWGSYGVKVILSLIPIIVTTIFLIARRSKEIKDEQEIKRRYNLLNSSIADKNIAQFIKKTETNTGVLAKLKSQMNILGIENQFENVSLLLILLFFGGAIGVKIIIGAGPLLMLYFGILAIATLYVLLINKMDARRRELKEEFMDKLREIASSLSVGLNFQTAINEAINSTKTSIVMAREMEKVRDAIFTGEKYSDAFMKMYEHLQIGEIREFAQMCFVYEKTGGQFVKVIHSFEDSYKMKRKVIQENEVFEASMKNDEKIIVGIPMICIIGFSIFMPSVIRGFYASFFGQLLGIVLFSIIYAGTLLMIRFVRIRGDE